MYEHFSDMARLVMELAANKARQHRKAITSEHILSGIIDSANPASVILSKLGCNFLELREDLDVFLRAGPARDEKNPLTPTAETLEIIRRAEEMARKEGTCVESTHLLLALVEDLGSCSQSTLEGHGIHIYDLRVVIDEVNDTLSS